MGQEFTANDEDPYCLDCFGNLYAKKCTACAKPITGKFHIVYSKQRQRLCACYLIFKNICILN